MKDLSIKYLGLNLKTPLIVGACGLTNSVDKIRKFAEAGAGAVVLKSLFEEQIQAECSANMEGYNADYPGAGDYIREYTRGNEVDAYLKLIKDVKKETDIPVIASVNCVSDAEWTSFAKSIEEAGADALELNVSLLPSDPKLTSEQSEKRYGDIINAVSGQIKIPLALKMSSYSASLANLIQKLSWTNKVSGFVLFNRYYMPDIDIHKMEVTTADVLSAPAEGTGPLRWIALMSGLVETDLAASTGVHDAEGVIKQILAGAAAVQIVSTVYKNGAKQIGEILEGLENWMDEKKFDTIADFKGRLSYKNVDEPAVFERTQFMKYFAGIS